MSPTLTAKKRASDMKFLWLTGTHIDMEGQFVADSLPCVYSDCELGLSV